MPGCERMKEDLYLKSPNKDIITLYIRPETDKQKILDLLKKEEPIIDNIKSLVTRKGIKASFQNLKTFVERMPPSKSGYIIVVSPEKLVYANDVRVDRDKYYCGGEFYSIPLEETLAQSLNPIGIITLDTKEATLAHIGNKIEILQHLTSGVEGKHSKGGQSQRRFERQREERVKYFFGRIGKAAEIFLIAYPITELIIAGCGQTKDKFVEGKYLDYRLQEKVKIILDTQYTGEGGIREALHLALPQLEKNAFSQEVKTVEDFFNLLGKQIECVVYGPEEIKRELPKIRKIIKIEELKTKYPKKTIVLRFRGEHYDKIKALGGIVGIKC